MSEMTFRVIRQVDQRFGVELMKPSGRCQLIPDFRDEAEAKAWIIQMQRTIRTIHPQPPGVKKRVG
jgi:hypothetical protein